MATILVIEDDPTLLETLCYNLEQAGFTVAAASDGIAGLELGANDYVVKPFSLAELLARVRAILRWNERRVEAAVPEVLAAGPLRLDCGSRRVWYEDREIALSYKEFDLLACLMRHAGVALSRDVLLERIWGDEFAGSQRTIDVHICWLREKIEP